MAHALTSGFSPATQSSQTATASVDWANINNIFASDDARATAQVPAPLNGPGAEERSEMLHAFDFDFSTLPANGQITGFEVNIEVIRSAGTEGKFNLIRLEQNQVIIANATNLAGIGGLNISGVETVVTLGDHNNPWSVPQSLNLISQIQNDQFGVGFQVEAVTGLCVFEIDFVEMSIFFNPGGGGATCPWKARRYRTRSHRLGVSKQRGPVT